MYVLNQKQSVGIFIICNLNNSNKTLNFFHERYKMLNGNILLLKVTIALWYQVYNFVKITFNLYKQQMHTIIFCKLGRVHNFVLCSWDIGKFNFHSYPKVLFNLILAKAPFKTYVKFFYYYTFQNTYKWKYYCNFRFNDPN